MSKRGDKDIEVVESTPCFSEPKYVLILCIHLAKNVLDEKPGTKKTVTRSITKEEKKEQNSIILMLMLTILETITEANRPITWMNLQCEDQSWINAIRSGKSANKTWFRTFVYDSELYCQLVWTLRQVRYLLAIVFMPFVLLVLLRSRSVH